MIETGTDLDFSPFLISCSFGGDLGGVSDSGEPAKLGSSWAASAAPVAKLRDQLRPAIVSLFVLTVLAGCVFSFVLFAIARPLFPRQAGGTLVTRRGVIIGSELIGQLFTGPEYFHSRPSAAGNGYDATSSGGTNLGPYNRKLIAGAKGFPGVQQLAVEYRKQNGLAPDAAIPIDAVTRSASGLDPDITPENARLQIPRVARSRGVSEEAVRRLVENHTKGQQFGILGAPRVPVLEVNLALDQSLPSAPASEAVRH